jgi:hypothetical protein
MRFIGFIIYIYIKAKSKQNLYLINLNSYLKYNIIVLLKLK